jgi:hypothetical protein
MNAFYWFAIVVGVLKLVELAGDWASRRATMAIAARYSAHNTRDAQQA